MDTAHESPQAMIEHQSAMLRHALPAIEHCRASLHQIGEGLAQRYALGLEVRLPQRQLLVAGEARHDALAAVLAAFDEARRRLAAGAPAPQPR